jgi:cytochrome c-type biogenesis protein CcmH
MCLECGTALNISNSPVADEERAFITQLIDRGLTKDQVKAALVREYGPRILAEPQEHGFSLTAWLVPIAAALAASALVVGLARHWRRRASAPDTGEPGDGGPALDPADVRRLDADLAAFDR